ncbi:hypothetical protein Bbelb_329900 [Branchiostoma belcheri]|nr:hypothetical protein Bbelb_329900 [Branchiostoma belcheri]
MRRAFAVGQAPGAGRDEDVYPGDSGEGEKELVRLLPADLARPPLHATVKRPSIAPGRPAVAKPLCKGRARAQRIIQSVAEAREGENTHTYDLRGQSIRDAAEEPLKTRLGPRGRPDGVTVPGTLDIRVTTGEKNKNKPRQLENHVRTFAGCASCFAGQLGGKRASTPSCPVNPTTRGNRLDVFRFRSPTNCAMEHSRAFRNGDRRDRSVLSGEWPPRGFNSLRLREEIRASLQAENNIVVIGRKINARKRLCVCVGPAGKYWRAANGETSANKGRVAAGDVTGKLNPPALIMAGVRGKAMHVRTYTRSPRFYTGLGTMRPQFTLQAETRTGNTIHHLLIPTSLASRVILLLCHAGYARCQATAPAGLLAEPRATGSRPSPGFKSV